MANLNENDVLLLVCRTLNVFVDEKLLTKDANGNLQPVSNAAGIEIGGALRTIAAQDEQNGANSIQFIRLQLLHGIQDLGFGTVLGAAQLANGDFQTIGQLTNHLIASSFDL